MQFRISKATSKPKVNTKLSVKKYILISYYMTDKTWL